MAPRAVQCNCIARASRPGTGHSAKPAASLLAQRGVEPRATAGSVSPSSRGKPANVLAAEQTSRAAERSAACWSAALTAPCLDGLYPAAAQTVQVVHVLPVRQPCRYARVADGLPLRASSCSTATGYYVRHMPLADLGNLELTKPNFSPTAHQRYTFPGSGLIVRGRRPHAFRQQTRKPLSQALQRTGRVGSKFTAPYMPCVRAAALARLLHL